MHQPVETPNWYVYLARRRHETCSGVAYSYIEKHRVTPLLGPYTTRAEAIDNVERGRELAIEDDRWAQFYEFGTLSDIYGATLETQYDA